MNLRIVLAFLILFLLLAGCAEEKPKQSTFICDDGTVVSSLDKCSNSSNQNNNNQKEPVTFDEKYDFCLSKNLVQEKDDCLQDLAIEFNKAVLCEELTNLDLEKCKRLVWKTYAVISKEIENCDSLLTEFDKVECIKEIALNASDKSICIKIDDFTKRGSCLAELAVQEKDLSICDSIEGSAKESCQFNVSIAISDVSLCNNFSLPSIKFDCISRIAKQNNDVSLCSLISISSMRTNCVNNLLSSS